MGTASLLSAVLAAASVAVPPSASADSGTGVLAYVVQTTFATSAGTSSVSELLVLQRSGDRAIVTVADQGGAALSMPTQVMTDGEISANSSDPAVACYNNAMTLLAASDRSGNPRGAVFVSFGPNVVRVAVPLQRARDTVAGQAFSGTGSVRFEAGASSESIPVRIETTANLFESGGTVARAAIETHTLVGSPERLAGKAACSLTRVERPNAAPEVPAPIA